jgi:hypothetical protein
LKPTRSAMTPGAAVFMEGDEWYHRALPPPLDAPAGA